MIACLDSGAFISSDLICELQACTNRPECRKVVEKHGIPYISSGKHKDVFEINSMWVLKVGSKESVLRDARVWESVRPEHKKYYAITYFYERWEVQEKCFQPAMIGQSQMKRLREIARNDGIEDIRDDNIGQVGMNPKIIDGRPKR